MSATGPSLRATDGAPSLEELAPELARAQQPLNRRRASQSPLFDARGLSRSIERAGRQLRAPKPEDPAYQRAAEWFLDNYYLVARSVRQVNREIPEGFQRRLPHAGADSHPRVLMIARALVETTSLDFDEAALLGFTRAYQKQEPLTIAELWALPTMLRITVLEALVHMLDAFVPSSEPPATWCDLRLEPAVGVERAIRALRQLAEIDWKAFFRATSAVEAALRVDPSGVYPLTDFETRDTYRKVVEDLAWGARASEPEVARLAVSLAAEHPDDPRRGHVGYYLLDRGRPELEKRIEYRARGVDRVRRWVLRNPTLAYLGAVGASTSLLVAGAAAWAGLGPGWTIALCLLALVPASSIALAFTNWWVTALLPPRALPKLDLSERVPEEYKTAVVIPALVAGPEDVDELLAQLELHYLSSLDPALEFVLLTDHVDAAEMPDDEELLAHAEETVARLNEKHAAGRRGPFHVLHREPRWNPAEGCFMGWERKRGKLEELNRLLRGDTTTSFKHHIGDPRGLEGIRFVITLDADTQLPLGAAKRLIGLLAHPLNRAELDRATGRVVSGYTVVQPRVETSPAIDASWFSRIFAGDTALDIYTRAVSDVYQDLFGSGSYVGKGIYDVDAFRQSLDGRVPENTLVSHDLFEGALGRAGLATDIVLFEGFPHHYCVFARRMHRWIRGDWQVLPWILPWASRPRTPLTVIDRWKIFDNLRRSLLAPSLLALLLLGWLVRPEHALVWSLVTLAVPLAVMSPSLDPSSWRGTLARWVAGIVILPYEAWLAADAIGRVFVRLAITRKHLLQWVTAAHTARQVRERSQRALVWREMLPAVVLTALLAAVVVWLAPSVFPVVAFLLAPWLLAPELVRWASAPRVARQELRAEDRGVLRRLARRTWLFYETFVGPADQWLPPDNFQQEPGAKLAHRTSPTNVGLLLVADLAAADLGYIGPCELSALLNHSFDSLGRLERYRGHFLNWYDTKTLEPLLPRYVSTVDSGNFAAALIALSQGVRQHADGPVLGSARWEGLLDPLDLFGEALDKLPIPHTLGAKVKALRSTLEAIPPREPKRQRALVLSLGAELPELERGLLEVLEHDTEHHDVTTFREARTWLERLRHQLAGMQSDLEAFCPWPRLLEEAEGIGLELDGELPSAPTVAECAETCARLRLSLGGRGLAPSSAQAAWLEQAAATLEAAEARARELREELFGLAARADAWRAEMDFSFMYDPKRKLFHIGYNATSDRLDPHYYDLLASEARIASFLAVIQRQVPAEHWNVLGRPVTRLRGAVALLSWGGTMFEYLLPNVFMRSPERTLLAQSEELAVLAHIDYGRKTGVPWGISESGYAALDSQHNYQYQSFGVPGLGLKRGLEDDLVVAPYACVISLPLRPRDVLDNLAELERMGALGIYGLFEAVDFHAHRADEPAPESAKTSQRFAIVRSHMAHHQGMILAALDNALNDDVLVERFHADPLIKAGELLLNERLPSIRVVEPPPRTATETIVREAASAPEFPGWTPDRGASRELMLLSNGRLTTMITDSGAGWTHWKGHAITRGGADPTCDVDGLFIYIRDQSSGRIWSAAPAPVRPRGPDDEVEFHPHKVEFHHRRDGLSIRTMVAVAPLDDVELRHVTLHNETDERRTLTVVSSGEPALEPIAAAARHPAFSKLFVECTPVPELHALSLTRRKRSPEDPSVVAVHRAVWNGDAVSPAGYARDRSRFIGRLRDVRCPSLTLEPSGARRARHRTPIDPVMALALEVVLDPGETVKLAFVTAVAKTSAAALTLARRFGTLHAVDWAIRDAKKRSARRLEKAGVTPALVPDAMRLASRLLFPGPLFRPPKEVLAGADASRHGLWGHGISGDHPLLVVLVKDPTATPLAEESLAAYRYLRACNVSVDLVFLDATASGYQADEAGGVRRFLASAGASPWLRQRGGIYVLATDQLGARERERIEACARVLIDAEQGSLAEQRQLLPAPAPPLPHFTATLPPDEERPARLPRPSLLFANRYGGFTEDGREYVIALEGQQPTPAPWSNVLANEQFGCLVSESSLGSSWSLNAGENRLSPWRNDPVSDAPAEVVYLRDEETAEVWSPTPLPAGLGAETVVRHGAGYTVYEQRSHGLHQELTVFVPPDAPVKLLRLRLVNELKRSRRLTATYYVEWVLGALAEDTRPHVVSELDGRAHCLLGRCTWNADFAERVAFVTASLPVHGHTCDRTEFIGRGGSLAKPEALARGLSGSCEPGADPCAALQTHLQLAPGESVEMHFVLGQGSDRAEALDLVERFRAPDEARRAWERLQAFWDGVLGAIQVKTPEPSMDLMLNRWLLYQSLSSRFFGRTAFYQSSGAYGFRDQLQDCMAFVHAAPALARNQVLEAASHQFEEGDVLHWWHPPAGRGVRTRCSDDLLWLPFVTQHYVSWTGDVSVLSEQVAFIRGAPLGPDEHDRYAEFEVTEERATLLEHCRRALVRGFTEGPHGLPLIGDGDWNDGMNRVGAHGRGESVWLGWFVYATAFAFSGLLERVGEKAEADRWRERARALRDRIENVAWDGAWYLRAFYDDGTPLGTAGAKSCQIDSIAQSWAALSGAGDAGRVEQALRSAGHFLVREQDRLVLLLDPPFRGAAQDPGYIKAYPPGVRENGGQYTHAATWLGWARTRLGDGAGAERIFQLLNPVLRAETASDLERYRVEPYVLPGDVYGAPFTGRGGWTWYTGAASWMWRLGVEAILGLRREGDRLLLNPCIPPDWPGCEATLRIDERLLHIVIDNSAGIGRGVQRLVLDGVPLTTSHLDLAACNRSRHELGVVLGSDVGFTLRVAESRTVP